MASTLFGSPIGLGDDWVESTVYGFVLPSANASAGAPYGASVTCRREPVGAGDLLTRAFALRHEVVGGIVGAKVMKEGQVTLGAQPGYAFEVSFSPEQNLPAVRQWHCVLDRGDGWRYHWVGTSTDRNFADHQPAFERLVIDWAAG